MPINIDFEGEFVTKRINDRLIVTFFSTWIRRLLGEPHIPSEYKANYRSRQFRTVAQLLLMASIATYSAIFFGLFFSIEESNNQLLILWSVVLSIIGLYELVIWWLYSIKDKQKEVSSFMVYLLAFNIGLAGIAYALLVNHLFNIFSDHHRIFLLSIVAAFISSGGWMFASLPLVGLAWVVSLGGGLALGLATFGESFWLLSILTAAYCVFLYFVILMFSRQYVAGLIAETEIEKQHHTVSLLLNDFEEKANDWLWETDKNNHLRHLSQKLIDACQTPSDNLTSIPYIYIIESLLDLTEETALNQFNLLKTTFEKYVDFSDIAVPVIVEGETRWWAFSAKALYDKEKKHNGWRGVTNDITSAVLREKEMVKQANTDTLTNIGNRHFFNQQLTLLCSMSKDRSAASCALMLLDLDNFKFINDAFGHAAGDSLLVEVSKRLKENIPDNAILSRLGGDEFAVIIPNTATTEIMSQLSSQLKSVISQPWHYGDNQIEIHVSIGIAFTSDTINSIKSFLRASDLALYAAKEAGRDSIRFFKLEMEEAANRKGKMLSEMKQSIANNEFVLHYQPQFDLRSGKLTGFEALVRWQHPTQGMISPADFIPIAEESGLIVPLGSWVLEQACLEAAKWPKKLSVAVNVSIIQIERTDLLEEIKSVLARSQLPTDQLEIEITESVLMTEQSPAFDFLIGLKDAGIRIALDDFGTGFSSLSYLQNLPLDKIKIDQSFINLSDMDNKACAIIRSIAQLANALNLNTIAEGIEREGQCELLSDLGVNSGQGYLYSRPMPAENILSFIKSKNEQS